MPGRGEVRQSGGDSRDRDSDRQRERSGGQCICAPRRPGRVDAIDADQLCAIAESPVDEHPVDNPELSFNGLTQCERHAPRVHPHRQGRGNRVIAAHDGDPPAQCAGFRPGVGRHPAVPVEVVLRDVEHDPGRRPQRRRPVKLERGRLDTQHIGALGPRQDVEHRGPIVPARCDRPPGRGHDLLDHRRRRRLAVRASHHQPGARRAGRAAPVDPPRQLHLAPHRDASGVGDGDQRVVRGESRRHDEQPGARPERLVGGGILDAEPVQAIDLFMGAERIVDHDDVGPRGLQVRRRRAPRRPEPGDHHVCAAQPGDEFGGPCCVELSHRSS